MSDLWCCIPVYNNAGTIADIARRCRARMENVLVIDDGSTDANLLELLRPLDVRVIRHEKNLGKGAALLTGFRHAADSGGQFLITLDGDGQHSPEDIPRFTSHLRLDTIVLGHRAEIRGTMPRSSRFGRRFSDFWIFAETGRWVLDSQSGFRAYPVRPVLELPIWSRHYNFEMEVLTRALWAGLQVQSVPIHVWYPGQGDRVSSFRPFRDNIRIARAHLRLLARRLLPIRQRRLIESK